MYEMCAASGAANPTPNAQNSGPCQWLTATRIACLSSVSGLLIHRVVLDRGGRRSGRSQKIQSPGLSARGMVPLAQGFHFVAGLTTRTPVRRQNVFPIQCFLGGECCATAVLSAQKDFQICRRWWERQATSSCSILSSTVSSTG